MKKRNDELIELMAKVFPGYEDFKLDSVTPSITGGDRLSFLIVCNEEAKQAFIEAEDIFAQLFLHVAESPKGHELDLHLRFEFAFSLFKLQFFAAVEGEHARQQHSLAKLLQEVDKFILWLVDEDKSLINVLQVPWDIGEQTKTVDKVLKKGS